jgi:hypothetical protein
MESWRSIGPFSESIPSDAESEQKKSSLESVTNTSGCGSTQSKVPKQEHAALAKVIESESNPTNFFHPIGQGTSGGECFVAGIGRGRGRRKQNLPKKISTGPPPPPVFPDGACLQLPNKVKRSDSDSDLETGIVKKMKMDLTLS